MAWNAMPRDKRHKGVSGLERYDAWYKESRTEIRDLTPVAELYPI